MHRLDRAPRHHATFLRSPRRWFVSRLRDAGDFLYCALTPIREAL